MNIKMIGLSVLLWLDLVYIQFLSPLQPYLSFDYITNFLASGVFRFELVFIAILMSAYLLGLVGFLVALVVPDEEYSSYAYSGRRSSRRRSSRRR